MVKDSQLYSATGGWGFGSFDGDNQTEETLTTDGQKACFACHVARKTQDFVFTKYHDR